MNEATGFCNGECPNGPADRRRNLREKESVGDVKNNTWWFSFDNQDNKTTYGLPFIPGRFNLDNMSISLNATHPYSGLKEYDVHSLFGHSEEKMTYEFLTDQDISPLKDKRIFLLSRSTFAGSGQYTSHWLGDNHRTLDDMVHSISGVMNFNMFGIPVVGPDTCGFLGDAGQDELCARWVQLATFFPYARQHRDKYGAPNEIWKMPEPWKSMAKNALYDRLQYMRHLYTCIYEAHAEGGTCFDPLFFYYPELDDAYNDIEHTFIVAGTFKVSPVLAANTT